jgi:hypothetical protein
MPAPASASAGGTGLEHRPSYLDLLARPDWSSASGQAWLMTFTDLVALMLAFFVLMFSMSQIEQTKWQGLVEALTRDLNALRQVENFKPAVEYHPEEEAIAPGADLDYLTPVIREQIAAHPLLAQATIHRTAARLVISLPAGSLHGVGAAVATPQAVELGSALVSAGQRAAQHQQLRRDRSAHRTRRRGARAIRRLGAGPGPGRRIRRNSDPCRLWRPDRHPRHGPARFGRWSGRRSGGKPRCASRRRNP